MIPLDWVSLEHAQLFKYTRKQNNKRMNYLIDNNQPYIQFATGNISSFKPEFNNIISIKLLGPVLRLRIALIGIILTCLNQQPILAALLMLGIELSYFSLIGLTILKYKYYKNWIVTVSRVNVNLVLITMNIISLYLSIRQTSSYTRGLPNVPFWI